MQSNHLYRATVLTASRLRLLGGVGLACMLGACGSSGGAGADTAVTVVSTEASLALRALAGVTATSTPIPTPTPTPTPTATPAGFLGVNVSPINYWGGDRQFMNLAVGSGWQDMTKAGWPFLPAAQVDRNGDLVSLQDGQHVARVLVLPAATLSSTGATIRCTWTGTATVGLRGNYRNDVAGDHSLQFFLPPPTGGALTILDVSAMSATAPLRNLDCREADADKQAVFAPEFLAALKPFGILRFLNWDGVNDNPKNPQWADRTPEGGLDQRVAAWENMVKLAKTLDADAWYNVPFDADEEYVVKLGKLIHDSTPAGRKVYVELSNEVWNGVFGATAQAQQEGQAEGLDKTNIWRGALLRYAEKSTWLMKLWTPIFADHPGQLVRVVSTQDGNPSSAEQVLGFGDTAQWVDALATAPYFGYDLLGKTASTDPAVLMPLVAAAARDQLATSAAANSAVAKKYGKRYIAYEAGQGLWDNNKTDRLGAVNRDPAMYNIYKSYIADWKARYGDTLMLFASTVAVGPDGAWGLRERAGQATADAPKYRAAIEFGR